MNIVSYSGASGQAPLVVGGTGTGVKIFPAVPGPGFNNGGNASFFNGTSASTTAAVVNLQSPQSEGVISRIRASGNVYLHGTSPTIALGLYKGSSLTSSSDTLIASISAVTGLTTAAFYPFAFQIDLQGDANSGLIQGFNATCFVNGATQSVTVASSGIPLTAQDLLTTSVPFCFSATFGVSDALNIANLQQFVLEQ